MTIEHVSLLVNLLNSTILAILFIYLKFNIEKRLKKYEHLVSEANELNTKMHDRLVEVEELIKSIKPIPEELRKRLLMNASRLKKHDSTISDAIDELIETWHSAFYSVEDAAVKFDIVTSRQKKCFELISKIKSKVDNLVK